MSSLEIITQLHFDPRLGSVEKQLGMYLKSMYHPPEESSYPQDYEYVIKKIKVTMEILDN